MTKTALDEEISNYVAYHRHYQRLIAVKIVSEGNTRSDKSGRLLSPSLLRRLNNFCENISKNDNTWCMKTQKWPYEMTQHPDWKSKILSDKTEINFKDLKIKYWIYRQVSLVYQHKILIVFTRMIAKTMAIRLFSAKNLSKWNLLLNNFCIKFMLILY